MKRKHHYCRCVSSSLRHIIKKGNKLLDVRSIYLNSEKTDKTSVWQQSQNTSLFVIIWRTTFQFWRFKKKKKNKIGSLCLSIDRFNAIEKKHRCDTMHPQQNILFRLSTNNTIALFNYVLFSFDQQQSIPNI